MNSHSSQLSGFADLCRSYCERWVSERVTEEAERARDARLIGAFIAMPFVLAAAMLMSASAVGEIGSIVSLTVGLLALPMVLCALVSLSASSVLVGLAGLLVYGGGIALAGITSAPAGIVLFVLALALPLEAWLVRRNGASLRAGAVVGLLTLGVLIVTSLLSGQVPSLSIGSMIVAMLYLATLVARTYLLFGTPRIEHVEIDDAADIINAVDGVVFHLSGEGVITDASAKVMKHFGVGRQMLVGSAFVDRIHVSDRVHFLSLLADLRHGTPSGSLEARIRCVNASEHEVADNANRSARYHAVDFRAFALEAAVSSAAQSIVIIARDVSKVNAEREALETALKAAECTQVSKGRFLATVSHELRTPLNSVIGFSDSLLQEVFGSFPDARQREYVELIHQSGTHLLSVVNTILDVSKIEAGSYPLATEPFAFSEAVALVHSMLGQQASRKGVTLCNRVKPALGDVTADRRAIQQVLINLVANAIKFTDANGFVTIDAAIDKTDLVFSVGDTGIGIAENEIAWLGKPFMQIQNDYTRGCEGTGLGLAMVKGLIELHHGEVSIASRVGEGTVVTVRIPLDGHQSKDPSQETNIRTGTIIDLKTDAKTNGDSYVANRKSA